MIDEPKNCVSYVKRFWPLLLARWAVFAAITSIVAQVAGWPLGESWPLILVASGTLNIAWIWVA